MLWTVKIGMVPRPASPDMIPLGLRLIGNGTAAPLRSIGPFLQGPVVHLKHPLGL